MKMILMVDYENVQGLTLGNLDPNLVEIWFFIGKSQNKIPFDLVAATQPFGNSLRWIKIEGNGKNNLDFHIAFELGRLCASKESVGDIYLFSKDKGYDAVVQYANRLGLKVKRIVNLSQLPTSDQGEPKSDHTEAVVLNLSKIPPARRPRTRLSLAKHLKNTFSGRMEETEIDTIIEQLFIEGKISETANRLKYNLEAISTLPHRRHPTHQDGGSQ
ncbi:MAG: PIN domain-containing protein [Syntrophorhabdaceae bacterium]|nr:PIN domain-containing protein [Syntrophorhabdaceae bacterium]